MDPFGEDFELPIPMEQDPHEHREGELYKKWFRTKTQSGFLTIRPWFAALKVSVDIGEINTADNKIKSHTLTWVDMIPLIAHLRSTPTGEFSAFGGARLDGKPISRIFKLEDGTWKCGHFEAKESKTGAFIPDTAKPLSSNFIRMREPEEQEVLVRLEAALFGYAARNPEWYIVKR